MQCQSPVKEVITGPFIFPRIYACLRLPLIDNLSHLYNVDAFAQQRRYSETFIATTLPCCVDPIQLMTNAHLRASSVWPLQAGSCRRL